MKTRFNLFRRAGVFYTEDTQTGKQTSLRTRDETEAKSLLNARNEAQRQPVLNLHLATLPTSTRPATMYLSGTAGRPSWINCRRAAGMAAAQSVTPAVSGRSVLTPCATKMAGSVTNADDFFAVFKDGKVSIVYFLKRLHNFALSLGWIALPVVAPYLWPKYEAKERRGITPDEQQNILAIEKKAEWKLFLELLWETGAAQGDARHDRRGC